MSTFAKNLKRLLIVLGVVLVWRGVWYLADIFLLPSTELWSAVSSVILGVIVLLLIDFKKKDISELG